MCVCKKGCVGGCGCVVACGDGQWGWGWKAQTLCMPLNTTQHTPPSQRNIQSHTHYLSTYIGIRKLCLAYTLNQPHFLLAQRYFPVIILVVYSAPPFAAVVTSQQLIQLVTTLLAQYFCAFTIIACVIKGGVLWLCVCVCVCVCWDIVSWCACESGGHMHARIHGCCCIQPVSMLVAAMMCAYVSPLLLLYTTHYTYQCGPHPCTIVGVCCPRC